MGGPETRPARLYLSHSAGGARGFINFRKWSAPFGLKGSFGAPGLFFAVAFLALGSVFQNFPPLRENWLNLLFCSGKSFIRGATRRSFGENGGH